MTGYTFNQLFDFTRTTSGTFVGSNGLLQTTPASANLLTFTQEFDNAGWTKDRVTVAANVATAPDGTSTADKVVDTAAGLNTYRIYNSLTLSAVSYTQTFYAKAAEYSWCYIRIGSAVRAWFNLSNGTLGTVEAGLTASITPAGDGWYRIACTIATATAGAGFGLIGLATGNGIESFTPTTGGMGIFVWGAQLQLGSTATTYARNNGGVFPPRFDYDPVTRAPRGILIEEQRTNLLTYSEQFDNAAWGKVRSSVTANNTLSPDGTTNADKLVEDTTASNTHSLQQTFSATSGTSYTFAIYLKAAEREWAALQFNSAIFADASSRTAYFNLATGAVGNTVGSPITNVTNAGNGWWRVSLTVSATLTATGSTFIYLSDGNGGALYTGNGTSGIFLYGAQVEAGAFATSYIPTVASQVTRTADVCTITAPMFAPWYSQGQGTWAFDFVSPVAGDRTAVNPSDGTNNNRMTIGFTASSPNNFAVFTGGALQALIGAGTQVPGAPSKMAAAYQANDFASTTNGAVPSTDTSGTVPTVNQLNVGSLAIGGALNGYIRRVRFYPFRASNNQLQALTT